MLTERRGPGVRPRGPLLRPVPAPPGGNVPAEQIDLDVIVPALNESSRIGRTLEDLAGRLSRQWFTSRLIVVDNGSVDSTLEVIDSVDTGQIPVEVLSCRARGKGAAVKVGVERATATFVGYVDADASTPPEALLTAMAVLDSGWDVVVASRRAVGASYVVPQSLTRRVGSRLFNIGACTVVGRMSDTQCGMKVFRTAAVRELFAEVTLGGFAFDVEVLARAQRAGLRIMEIPVSWSDSVGSSFRPVRDGSQAFRDLVRVHRVMSRGGEDPRCS